MRNAIQLLFFCLFINQALISQTSTPSSTHIPGTDCTNCVWATPPAPAPGKSNSNNSVMNGNNTIATSYTQTACGLNFTQCSHPLYKRSFSFALGVTQPATYAISGIPPCAIIQKAFLYVGTSGNGVAVNATLANPAATSSVFPMTIIGQSPDKCWGYSGTYTYRADVTALISGNGNYIVSGIPVVPTPNNDADGATLFIIYADPTQNYTGSIVIADGSVESSGATSKNITGFNVCGPTSTTTNFMIVADLQKIANTNCNFNSLASNFVKPLASDQVWDYITAPGAPATSGQNNANYGLTTTGDCYNFLMAGMYYQSACLTCPLALGGLTVTAASTPSCPTSNATVTVAGGTGPYTYTWTPSAQTTSVATGLASGSYTVHASDATGCFTGSAVVSVTTTPLNTISVTSGTICSGNNVSLTATGSPNYTWAPGGSLSSTSGSVVTANPAATTIYSVSFTNTAGCVGTQTAQVIVNPTPTISSVSNNGPVCQGAGVSFTVNTTTAGSTSYAWFGPSGYNSTAQNAQITNATPANSGNYTVNVTNTFTNGGNCQASGTATLGVVPVGPVAVTPSFTLCQASNLNLVSSATGATSYSWTGPSAFSTTSQNPSVTGLLPVNAGNYSVTAYFTSPITTLVCTSNAVSNVSVVATSPVNVNVPNNICQYATANINALAAGAVGYSWAGPNNFSSNQQVSSIPNIQPASAGMYFVTASFAIGSVTCTTNGSNQISVVPVNPVVVTPTVNVCQPANAGLSSNSSGAATYSWTGPNNYTANIANPTLYQTTPSMSGIYTVSTSYNNGNLICYNSNTVQLIISSKITFTLDDYRQMCYNSLLNVNGPAGATSYSWSSSNGYTATTQNLTIPSIQPSQSGTYTLDVQLGPCITTQKIQIDVLTPLAFTLTPANKTICLGDSVELIAGSIGGSQNYAYVWTPGTFLGSPTGSVQYGHPVGTTIYNLAGYDIACPNYTVFYTFTVQVNQPPKPDLQLDKLQGCQPLCLFYNTKTQNDAAVTTYDFGGIQTVQSDSFYYCLNEPGIYNLKISSLGKNGCKGVYEYPQPIIVYPKPQSDFSWTPDVVTTSENHVTFIPAHTYGPVTSMNWMFSGTGIDGVDTSNIQNPQRIFEVPGKYPVMLIQRTDMGCVDTVIKFLDIIEDFNIYIPNAFTPNGDGTNDVFNVKGLGLKATGFSMEIFDRWGHSMFSSRDVTKGWDGTVKGQPVPDDVYIYKISAVGANTEGRKEYVGHVTLMK